MAADSVGAMLQAPRESGGDRSRSVHSCSFHHEAILHRGGADGFVAYAAPLIERALEEEAPVLVAVSAERIARLREALGSSAELVGFADMVELGTNPARIIPAWKVFLARHAGRAPALGIGEPVWPGRNAAELDECARHEGLLNLAFNGGGAWRLMCPYDLDGLDDAVIELARHGHPHLIEPHTGRSVPNTDYPSAQIPDWPFEGDLPGPISPVRVLPFGERDLGALRHFVSDWAGEQTLEQEPVEELVLAVNEIATNSIRHGGGSGTLQVWRDDEVLLCEVKDAGHIRNPMLGRVEPDGLAATSRGLWIANQFCDLVQIRSSEAGSVVRMHKRLGPRASH
jgi:anti-sigma regulatory factor (Ser/Thr protein kinase)